MRRSIGVTLAWLFVPFLPLARGSIPQSTLLPAPFPVVGTIVRGLPDLDLDGKPEILVADPVNALARVLSGATGVELYAVAGPLPPGGKGEGSEGETGEPPGADSFATAILVLSAKDAAPPVNAAVYAAIAGASSLGPFVEIHLLTATGTSLLRTIAGTGSPKFGSAMGYLGDLDLDGVPDLAIGDPDASDGAGHVSIVSSLTGTILFELAGNPGERLGSAISSADHDLSGDGIADFVMGAPATGSGAIGRSLVCSTATFAVLFEVNGGAPDDGFGQQVVNLGKPPQQPTEYVARFAVAAPAQNGTGAVHVFEGAVEVGLFVGPTPGKDFGRLLTDALSTRDGGSNELGIADLDTYYVCSPTTGLVYYATSFVDEVISIDSVRNWNAEDNYADMAVLHGGAIDLLSGKTLFFETQTLFGSFTSDESLVHATIEADVGSSHAGRPFLLLAGALLDPLYTGANQAVGSSALDLPLELTNALSLYFLGVPPVAVSLEGKVTYAFDVPVETAAVAGPWCTANSMVFVGLLKTGTTLVVTNPLPLASVLGS